MQARIHGGEGVMGVITLLNKAKKIKGHQLISTKCNLTPTWVITTR
jgi:hypothetical protein